MKWFSNLSTRTKILGSFGAVCVLLAGLGLNSIRDLRAVEENLRIVYQDYTVPATDIGHMASQLGEYANNTTAIVNARAADFVEEHVKEQAQLKKDIKKSLDDYGATVLRVSRSGKSETEALETCRKTVNAYFDAAESTAKAKMEALLLKDPEANAKANAEVVARATGPDHEKYEKIGTDVQTMLETLAAVAADMNDDGHATVAQGVKATIFGSVIAVIIAIVSGILIAARIANPLRRAVGVLESVAGGDFTAHLDVDSEDEVGAMAKMLNAAVGGMNGALVEVKRAADQVAGAASQLSAASQSISSGAQEQASSLEETAASLEEMTGTVKQNSDNSQQASSLAQGARDVADEGGKVVGEAVVAMGEINQSSKKIADIITTIDEIAFQTNLLALNAAVEAARAGEQGRGFAVVAAEVRTLAQRSAGAAKEIKTLIQDSVRKVDAGSALVGKSGVTLKEIVASVKRVSDIVSEIAAATKEQSTGIEQVNTAVTQMDSVTQSNASQTEELSGTAETLAMQAKTLQDLVARFRLSEGGDRMVSVRAHRDSVAASAPRAKAAPRHAEAKRVVSAPVADDQLESVSLDDIQPASVAPAHPGADKGFEEF